MAPVVICERPMFTEDPSGKGYDTPSGTTTPAPEVSVPLAITASPTVTLEEPNARPMEVAALTGAPCFWRPVR